MEFSDSQMQTLKESFARDKMSNAPRQSEKRQRLHKTHYEKVDIATLIEESKLINRKTKDILLNNIDKVEIISRRPYTYICKRKKYINPNEIEFYRNQGFTIKYE